MNENKNARQPFFYDVTLRDGNQALPKQSSPMAKTVTAMEARQNFGNLLNQVSLQQEEVVIERAGKPLARLVNVDSPDRGGKLDFRDIGKLPNGIWEER